MGEMQRKVRSGLGGSVVRDFEPGRAVHQLALSFLRRVSKRVDFAWGTVYVLDRRTGTLRSVAHLGEELDFIMSFRFRFGNGLSAWVLERKKPVMLRNIHHGRRHRHHPVRAFLTFPLVYNNVAIGTVTLAHQKPFAFREEECRYLERATRRLSRILFPFVFPALQA